MAKTTEKTTKTENERIVQLKDYWKGSEQEHNTFIERFRENFRFTVGGDQQWDPADIADLDDAQKPHITYNEILPKINAIVGEYLDNQMEVKVHPRRGGTVTGSNILTALGKHTADMCNGEYEEATCFNNGIIGGEGILHWYIDYANDPFNGEILIESKWPTDVIFDESNRKYDCNKGKYVFDEWWWDIEELKLAYPKHALDIIGGGLDTPLGDKFFGRRAFYTDRTADDYGDHSQTDVYSPDDTPMKKWRYRTRVCWWKSWSKMNYLWDSNQSVELLKVKDEALKKAQILSIRDPQRFRIIERTGVTLHKTVHAGYLVLEDIENPMGARITRFPYSRFCPYWLGGYKMGAVDNAKDPQREVNKRASQTLHILNITAKMPWLNKEGEGADPDELEDQGSSLAPVINYKTVKPEQGKPPQVSMGHFTLWKANSEAIGRIMGVRETMEGGVEEKNQSGIAIYRRLLQGSKMVRPVLNNFGMTRQLTYEGLTELIRYSDVYSQDEIRQIVDDEDLLDKKMLQEVAASLGPPPQPPDEPNPQALEALKAMDARRGTQGAVAVSIEFENALKKYQAQAQQYDRKLKEGAMQMLFKQIKSIGFGRYGTKVSQSLNTPTMRLAFFQLMLEARKAGIMIPDDFIVEKSDWPGKDKLVERMRQQPVGVA